MSELEKQINARGKMIKQIIDSILYISGSREIIEGPRGEDVFRLMYKEVYDLITQYEDRFL